jgi:acyl-CoA thioester hydrolase
MTHRYPVEVHYEDTDMGGIVYHANFLKFTERARSAWVRELGIDQNAMRAAGRVFVVTRMVADFLAPAYFEDALGVVTRILRVTPARLEMAQSVWRGEAELFRAVTTLVEPVPNWRITSASGRLSGMMAMSPPCQSAGVAARVSACSWSAFTTRSISSMLRPTKIGYSNNMLTRIAGSMRKLLRMGRVASDLACIMPKRRDN